jgi:hypothetical protein
MRHGKIVARIQSTRAELGTSEFLNRKMENRSFISEIIDLWSWDRIKGWNNPSWWNLLALWPVPFVLFFCIHAFYKDAQIANRQQSTIGIINAHDPPNHDRYSYIFEVNQKQYAGWAYPNDKRDFSIGESVVVYYDPNDPAKNSTADFHVVSIGELFFVPFCVVACLGIPAFIFIRRRTWRRKIADLL